MARTSYDSWPELVGSQLFVTVGSRLFFGEFMGLKAPSAHTVIGRQVEWAWALNTGARVVYFDPENPAVVVHPSALRSKTPRDAAADHVGNRRASCWPDDGQAWIDQAKRLSARADELIGRHRALIWRSSDQSRAGPDDVVDRL